jgi:hypothetical protein
MRNLLSWRLKNPPLSPRAGATVLTVVLVLPLAWHWQGNPYRILAAIAATVLIAWMWISVLRRGSMP